MFKKKENLNQEKIPVSSTESQANQDLYKSLDEESFKDADRLISSMASQQRKQMNSKPKAKTKKQKPSNTETGNEEVTSSVKFGYIEETDPSDELVPLVDLDHTESAQAQAMIDEPSQPIKNPYAPEELDPIDLNDDNYNNSIQSQGSLTDFNPIISDNENFGKEAEPVNELNISDKKRKKKKEKSSELLDENQKKKKNKNLINILFFLIVVIGFGLLFGYTYFSNEIELLLGGNETIVTDTLNKGDLSNSGQDIDYSINDLTYDVKLSTVENLSKATLAESLEYLAEFNKATTGHLKDITNEVVLHKSEKNRSIENEMQEIQSAIKKDIETIKTYKKVFIKFGDVEVITKVIARLENAHSYAGAIKNNMTEKAMAECANLYIEEEQLLNQSFVNELANYLEINDVTYEIKDTSIKYSIKDANSTSKK